MTPEDMELLQVKILELCHASGQLGFQEARLQRKLEDTGYLKRELVREGSGVDNATLERQLKFLQGEGLLTVEADRLRPDLRRWLTTSEGDKFLMLKGLI